jgi:hypothetical protein
MDPEPTLVETDPKVILLVCPECGEDFDKAIKLGYHRRVAHNVVGKHNKASPKGKSTTPRPAAVRVVEDMARDAGAGKGIGIPSETDLSRAMARAIGTATGAVAIYAVETDPRFGNNDALKEQTVDYLSPSKDEAMEIAAPLARAFSRSPLNKKYGRAVVDNIDVVGSIAALVTLSMHWRHFYADRRLYQQSMQGDQPFRAPVVPEFQPPQANGAVPSRDGRVLTKEDVDRMRMNN